MGYPITILAFIITQVCPSYLLKQHKLPTIGSLQSATNGRPIYGYPLRHTTGPINRPGRSSKTPNSRLLLNEIILKQVTPLLQPPPAVDNSKRFPYLYYIHPETENGINVITNGKTGLLSSNDHFNPWTYPSVLVSSLKPATPITEPPQENLVEPTPVNKLTKAAVEPVAKFIENEQTTTEKSSNNEENTNEDSLDNTGKYEYGYSVNDGYWGTKFLQVEHRDGEKTSGRYSVALPDGRMQHVQYWSDSSGYHAQVTYENLAKHNDPLRM